MVIDTNNQERNNRSDSPVPRRVEVQYPKYLEFIKDMDSVGSDGTGSDDEADFFAQDYNNPKGELDLHGKRLKAMRRDYRNCKLAPF